MAKGQDHEKYVLEEFKGRLYKVQWSPLYWELTCGVLSLRFQERRNKKQPKWSDSSTLCRDIVNSFKELSLMRDHFVPFALKQYHQIYAILIHHFSHCSFNNKRNNNIDFSNLITMITDDYIGGTMHSSKPTLEVFVDLHDLDLSNQRFSDSDSVDFSYCDFRNCRMPHSHWNNVSFIGSDFTQSYFKYSELWNISFQDCILDDCDLTHCQIKANQEFLTSVMRTGFDINTEISWNEQSSEKKTEELFNCALCCFGNVRSMIGCKLDWKVYDMNPEWFDLMGVSKPIKPITPPPRPMEDANPFYEYTWLSTPSD